MIKLPPPRNCFLADDFRNFLDRHATADRLIDEARHQTKAIFSKTKDIITNKYFTKK